MQARKNFPENLPKNFLHRMKRYRYAVTNVKIGRKFHTIKAVALELHSRGGFLTKVGKKPFKYAPSLPHLEGESQPDVYTRDDLIAWANEHLNESQLKPSPFQ